MNKRILLAYAPPVPTALFSMALLGLAALAPIALEEPEINPLGAQAAATPDEAAAGQARSNWTGPRPEARREILEAPLFAEDRRLPAPFLASGPAPDDVTPDEPQDHFPPQDALGMNPPGAEPPQEEIVEAPPEPVIAAAPPPAPEPVKVAAPLDLPELKLLGVFIRKAKGTERALLENMDNPGEQLWIEKGDNIADWQLTIVSPEAVRLEAGDRHLTLELFQDQSAQN